MFVIALAPVITGFERLIVASGQWVIVPSLPYAAFLITHHPGPRSYAATLPFRGGVFFFRRASKQASVLARVASR
jgi:hypothetical protein